MQKLTMILLILVLCTGIQTKQRKCSGCKWCVVTLPTKRNKHHIQGDCSNCRWCIKKKLRHKNKVKRLEKYSKITQTLQEVIQEEDPDVLAQQLIQAIKSNKPLDELERLIDQGANLDWEDKEGRTPLHWAAIEAQPDTVGLLLVHQADIEAKDYRGNTPLHLVIKYRPYPSKRKDIIQHLIFEGASIYDRNQMGLNVIESAISMDLRVFALLTSLKPSFIVDQITF